MWVKILLLIYQIITLKTPPLQTVLNGIVRTRTRVRKERKLRKEIYSIIITEKLKKSSLPSFVREISRHANILHFMSHCLNIAFVISLHINASSPSVPLCHGFGLNCSVKLVALWNQLFQDITITIKTIG